METKQIEGAALDLGGFGEKWEGGGLAAANGVSGQRGEVGEKRPEAVDGQAVVGLLAAGLALGGGRRLGLGDG